MTSASSSYSYNSQSHFSEDDHSDQISQNIVNNSNTNKIPSRASLFIEDFPNSKRQTINDPRLNIINRTSTHSFMVFIDDSIYGNIPSSSASLWSSNISSSSNDNIGSSNNDILDNSSISNRVNTRIENSNSNVTNPADIHNNISFVNNNLPNIESPTTNSNSSCTSNSHASNLNKSHPIIAAPLTIPQQGEDNLLLRRKPTEESMSTGNTEYFETNEFLASNNYFNGDDIQLLRTSTRNVTFDNDNNENNDYGRDEDSTDSTDTQDTEILDTHIRNSQSLVQNIRDSVRTLSTILLTQNSESSSSKKENKKTLLGSLNQNDKVIDISKKERDSPKRQTTVRNRTPSLSSEVTPSPKDCTTEKNNPQMSNLSQEINQIGVTEPSYSSIFQYDNYNDTVESDIEQAVKLLKNEVKNSVPKVGYVHSKMDQNSIFSQENKQREEEEEQTENDEISINSNGSSDKLVLHDFKIPSRLSFSQPPTPIIGASESHVPRSPSLINGILVASPPKQKTLQSSPIVKLHQRTVSLTNHATVTPLYSSISFDTKNLSTSPPHSTKIPKVHVLQSVSGSSRWKPSPKTESRVVSMLGPNEFRNPIKKLSFHEDMRNSIQESISTGLPNVSNVESFKRSELDNIIYETPTFENELPDTSTTVNHPQTNIIPPLPTETSMFRYNTTMEIPEDTGGNYYNYNNGAATKLHNGGDATNPIHIQHIDSPSIHSFDSQSYTFWEVYSIERIISLFIVCFIVPPLFFMIYMGSTCGIDDYKLMKFVLNEDHRIGLFRGFLWDIDLNWLRNLSLLLGCVELIIVFACIGIGFGVGLTR